MLRGHRFAFYQISVFCAVGLGAAQKKMEKLGR